MNAKPLAIQLLLVAVGCNSADEEVFRKGGNGESKPKATLLGDLKSVAGANATDGGGKAPPTVAAEATYDVKVTSNSGAKLCTGQFALKILSDFNLQFPEAKLKCVSLTIDLAGILGAGGGGGQRQTGKGDVTHDGKVLALREVGGAVFDPPRPMLLGPVVQDATKYKGFKRRTEHRLAARDQETGRDVTGTGTFALEVLDHQTTYAYKGNEFDKVLHWTMAAEGFNTPAKHGLTFETFEWLWNTRPIMIPGFRIVGTLGDFITSDDDTTATDITGRLTIAFDVVKYSTGD